LRLRRGAIDLVGQKKIGENGAVFELKLLRVGVVYGDADNVGREHIRSELDTVKTGPHSARKRLSQSSLTDAWNIFDQEVASRQKTGQGEAQNLRFTADRHGKRGLDIR
jgi:hypothetical protein